MRKIAFFSILIISLFIMRNLVQSSYDLWQKQDLIVHIQKQLILRQKENQILKQQLRTVKTTGFVNEEAHNKLFLVKPGEQIVVLPQTFFQADMQQKKVIVQKPNWLQWWELFFQKS